MGAIAVIKEGTEKDDDYVKYVAGAMDINESDWGQFEIEKAKKRIDRFRDQAKNAQTEYQRESGAKNVDYICGRELSLHREIAASSVSQAIDGVF